MMTDEQIVAWHKQKGDEQIALAKEFFPQAKTCERAVEMLVEAGLLSHSEARDGRVEAKERDLAQRYGITREVLAEQRAKQDREYWAEVRAQNERIEELKRDRETFGGGGPGGEFFRIP